ncbi:hypothetical protein [Enterococcus italicus]|uniref:hypothetical protein n=1 Tax=Enterococcus italicus TaxID=246144 RepID=UPI003F489755
MQLQSKKPENPKFFSQTFGFAGLFRSGSCYLTIYSVDCSALNAFGTTFLSVFQMQHLNNKSKSPKNLSNNFRDFLILLIGAERIWHNLFISVSNAAPQQ